MDIVSRALALPIPLTKEYILSLPRIPKDFKVPKRVCRDVKGGSGGAIILIIILLLLCCCCICSICSTGTGGFLLWKRRKSKK